MDTKIVEVLFPSGETIKMQVSDLGGEKDASFSSLDFSGFKDSAIRVAREMKSVLDDISPDRGSIEFGLAASLESGALTGFLAKGSAEANVKVTLEWESKE